ncbi:uncharacterized protein FFB20_09918 [Fusarium fujikuroi]|uniref:Uncharacterized protein n=1 Tax=Fusarium fujikuroi TaxID=5127 RepID=A0A2H3RU39_FUSFU|nr:uncharacterized protein Y057_6506 [Fusarium fujikuroi]QGI62709.1 hypothetical protein CEK27_006680 [Fusarium fujikuroi]QGI79875.1 hypothetical protein CEK25_006604 [Fusarium fujikuroi]QGI93601.1 hypothetical protein CEK26_006670 [Fusarium fujikuroi]SCN79542.1 uncharacterized protein FFE2_04406 [Fusarium fujikuroi]
MTSRNLNKTWRDIVFEQYEADHAADVPFPIHYLIYGDQWKTDIIIDIPNKIDVHVFRQALLHAASSRRLEKDPAYKDDLLSIRARIPPSSQSKNDAHSQDDAAAAGNSG